MTQSTTASTTATTLTDVPDLSFSVDSGKVHYFHFAIRYQTAATTTGLRLSVSGPSGYGEVFYRTRQANDGTASFYESGAAALGTTSVSASVVAASTDYVAEAYGFWATSASGTLKLQFASEVSGSNVQVSSGNGMLIGQV